VADQVLMLQFSRLFGDLARRLRGHPVEDRRARGDAADALGITAHRLKALGVIDKIVNEPVGGAHRDMPKWMAAQLKRALQRRAAPDRRPQAQGTAAAPLRAAACLRALHRHQGALNPRYGVWPWPPAAGAIPPPCCIAPARRRRALGIEVLALHVHHGLQPQADAWLAQVRARSAGAGARPSMHGA
jgi:hypothetical protein